MKSSTKIILQLLNCVVLISPLIVLTVTFQKISELYCISVTNKMYMLLIGIFIYAYTIKNYMEGTKS